jgi:hypothetical protein
MKSQYVALPELRKEPLCVAVRVRSSSPSPISASRPAPSARPSPSVTPYSNPGICSVGLFSGINPGIRRAVCTRTENDARKEDSVIFVLISRTNFSRNFVRVLCATIREFSAVTMHLNPRKGLKTNKRNSGICQGSGRSVSLQRHRPLISTVSVLSTTPASAP